jgi:hypothetical protein
MTCACDKSKLKRPQRKILFGSDTNCMSLLHD